MCGIAGLINLNGDPVPLSSLRKMTDAIKHRGPDGEGQWIDNNVGIGHRRLAIIDLTSAGHQPMSSLDDRYILSYNGEVYNFKEIRNELKTIGYKFKSQTDTEVVLNSLVHWGKDALLKFNGMFAFALWDKKEKTLLIGRDRYGIKPLYYSFQKNTFAFGSEQKAITAQTNFIRKVNKPALFEYFTFQNIFTNKTLHKDIKILEPGHYFEVDLLSKKIEKTQYWDFNFSEPETIKDGREYIEELDRLFTQALERQLVADVPVGSYLSGGMDSGSITAKASKYFQQSNNYLQTFTVGFDLSSVSGMELSFDERAKAEYMSYKFQTEHYEMVLKSGDMERCMSNFTYHLEEPRVGQSYPNYYAAKLASKFVKVVLSGTGSDELFAGYPWRYYKAVNNDSFDDYIDKYYDFWQRLIPNKDIKNVFSPINNEVKSVWTRDIFANVFKNKKQFHTPEEYINHSLYFEAKTFLHGLLVMEDKLSMAHSLETRVPFLDNDLVDFAQKIPVKLKLGDLNKVVTMNENQIGKLQKTSDGKLILRQAMSNYLPQNIHSATKQGFSSPDNSWFKGDSIDFVRKKLLNNNAKIYQYMDKKTTQKMINEHLTGERNRRLFIWSLLNFEEWCNIYG